MIILKLSTRKTGYVLNAIDVFSRKSESVKLNSKNVEEVRRGFNELFKKFGSKPENLQSDKEGAILSLKNWLKDQNINLYHVPNAYDGGYSAPIIERLNGTMKNYMYNLKREKSNQNWKQLSTTTVKTFPSFYNNKVHKTIGTTPDEVYNGHFKHQEIKDIHLENYLEKRNEPKNVLKLNDVVRLQKPQNKIEKKLEEKYYKKPYKIIAIKRTNPITYKLDDIEGSYYKQQLIKI